MVEETARSYNGVHVYYSYNGVHVGAVMVYMWGL